jgi:hypothetical protein
LAELYPHLKDDELELMAQINTKKDIDEYLKAVRARTKEMSYTCQYCRKDFMKESSLAVHSCEPRRRRMERDEAGVRLGFHSYIKFYELTQGSAKLKTFDDFADSPYYKAFVKFGRYCVSVKAINPARFH